MINITQKSSTQKKKKKTWKIKTNKKTIEIPVKEVVEIAIFIVVLFTLTFGTFWILRASLKTKTPIVVVISGSMEPTIYRGDLLFVKGVDPETIEVGDHILRTGDIIVFKANWSIEPIVHRVVDRRLVNVSGTLKWQFQTWGDNNDHEDDYYVSTRWTFEDDVIGIVVGKIRYIGHVKIWLTETGLAIPIVIILALALMISIAWDLTHPDKEEDKKKKPKRKWFKRKKESDEKEEIKEDPSSSVDLEV